MIARRRFPSHLVVALLALLLGIQCLSKAWVSDDAYITLRTVDNLQHGLGPRWNAAERVQAYTHPLWMLLLAALTSLTREHYVTTMLTGIAISALAVFVVVRWLARSAWHAAFVFVTLAASHAFTDYATSGLENPLVHVLLALFLVAWFAGRDRVGPEIPFVLAAALACTRLDALLLVAPALVATRFTQRPTIRAVLPGAALLAAWLVFALVYYGSLLPTSALAKLDHELPRSVLVRQGLDTIASALHLDPGTLLVTAAGMALPLLRRDRVALPIVAGIGLHLVYTVWVGGDFMTGRFLTPSAFVATALVARGAERPRTVVAIAAVAALGTGIVTLREKARIARLPAAERHFATIDDRGIADERRFYEKITGWRARPPGLAWPDPSATAMAAVLRDQWTEDPFVDLVRDLDLLAASDSLLPEAVAAARAGRARPVVMRAAVGVIGYRVGRDVHVLDLYTLGDPLRARLPAEPVDPFVRVFLPRLQNVPWRPGHYIRRIPPGYATTLLTGENHLEDPELRALWSDVALVTRAPLFASGRWAAIARLAVPGADVRARRWAARTARQEP